MNKSLVCADAGILIKLVVAEEDSDQADALWEQWKEDGVKVVSPGLLLFELTSVLRNKVHRGLLSLEEGEKAFDTVHRLPVQVLTPSDLHRRAWELAARFNCPAAYDAHYLALAEMVNCEFWTADRRLLTLLKKACSEARSRADFRTRGRLRELFSVHSLFNVVKDELSWVHWLGEDEGGQR